MAQPGHGWVKKCSLFRLEISMNDMMSVAVLYRSYHLLKESSGFVFAHLRVSTDVGIGQSQTYAAFPFGHNIVE